MEYMPQKLKPLNSYSEKKFIPVESYSEEVSTDIIFCNIYLVIYRPN
jgi:hypothetical protein